MVYDMVRLALSLLACMCAIFALVRSIHEFIIAKSEKKKRRQSSIAEYKELQAASSSTYTAQVYKTVQGFSVRLNIELQNRFIPGRSAYETARSNGNLRSIIFRDAAGLQKLLDEKAGTGEFIAANKERVDFGQSLGQYVDPVAKTKAMTTVGIIHYTAEGVYIVPARPLAREDFNG